MVHYLITKCVVDIDGYKSPVESESHEYKFVSTQNTKNEMLAELNSSAGVNSVVSPQLISDENQSSEVTRIKNNLYEKHDLYNTTKNTAPKLSIDCKALRKSWQLGDQSTIERYLKECIN